MPSKPASTPGPADYLPEAQEFLRCLSPDEASALVFAPARDAGVDFVLSSQHGSHAEGVELKGRVDSARDLHTEILRLARYVGRTPELARAWLLVRQTKLTSERLSEEWRGVLEVLRPDVSNKLAAAAVSPHGAWSSEPLAHGGVIERWLLRCTSQPSPAAESSGPVPSAVPTVKFFDIWKLLLSAWLQKSGALPIHTVVQRSGATHPTVAAALKRLEHRGEVRRHTDRAVELRGWPRTTYLEMEPLLPALRKTVWFVDRSGRPSDPQQLLGRIAKIAPANVALGGVHAAKILDPEFDLLGTPRVDLTIHVPKGGPDLAFVKKVDPALQRSDTDRGAVLAIHQLTRREALFGDREEGLPLVDPSEVVLDLSELRLSQQIDELVAKLRSPR